MNNSLDGLACFEYTNTKGEKSEIFVCGGADGALYFYRLMNAADSNKSGYYPIFLVSSEAMQKYIHSSAVMNISVDEENNRFCVATFNSLLVFDLKSVVSRLESVGDSVIPENIDRMTGIKFTSGRKFIDLYDKNNNTVSGLPE